MHLTVALCTWNRCALLRQALEQLTRLRIPAGVDWELLVVNNACTDATDEIISDFERRLSLRRLFEPEPGLSHAKNRAIHESGGDYILWTDDDLLVSEQWMSAYVDAFRQWPQAVLFGGPVRPHFVSPPPLWLQRVWTTVADRYGMIDLSDQPFRFERRERLPHGGNSAVRAREQREHLYDPQLGHRQKLRIAHEETPVSWELISKGYEGWWIPAATVRHQITADRMNLRYLRQTYSDPERYIVPGKQTPYRYGSYARKALRALRKELKYRYRRLMSPPEVWIQDLIWASIAWGRLLNEHQWEMKAGAGANRC
jgi:glucosyl-dolichyl phosphate glucuronosyltransferase